MLSVGNRAVIRYPLVMKRFTVFAFVAGSLLVSLGLAVGACSSDSGGTPPPPADANAVDSTTSASDSAAAEDADTSPAGRGARVATSLGCHGCHDSPAGIMAGNKDGIQRPSPTGVTTIYPANLTPDPETGLGTASGGGWTDEQIARAIGTGVDDECRTLCLVMPRFRIGNDDMAALIAYLRSLPPVSNDVAKQGCPELDASASGAGQFVDAGDCP